MFNSNIVSLYNRRQSSTGWILALVLLAGCNTSSPPPAAQSKPAEPQVVEQPVASTLVEAPQPEKLMSDKPAETPAAEPTKEAAASPVPAQVTKDLVTTERPAAVEKPLATEEPAKPTESSKPVEVAAVDQVAQAKAPTRSTSSSRSTGSSTKKTPAKVPVVTPPPPPPSIPPVLMSDSESKTCLVKVGDTMPAIELPGTDGQTQSLAKLMGEKLTVVVFWTASHPYAVEELGDLASEVAGPLASKGVKVVAINEGDTPEAARKAAQGVGAGDLVQLHDTGGQALAKVATRRLPRTYLLDSSGKILWFDLEYSRSTRRELTHALQFVLGK